jgi:hypothetical protein
MAAKGRRNNRAARYQDSVPAGSALQGVLVKQDSQIDQVNSMLTALKTAATALKNAADIAAVNTAGTALETSLNALSALTKVTLK